MKMPKRGINCLTPSNIGMPHTQTLTCHTEHHHHIVLHYNDRVRGCTRTEHALASTVKLYLTMPPQQDGF